MKINKNFKAIYNVFTQELAVLYGDAISMYKFESIEEWTKISYNGDSDHPNYLHVQSDYDEHFQLLFYPRQDNDSSLHEEEGTYFNSIEMNKIPENIKIVYSDYEFGDSLKELLKESSKIIDVESGL